MYLNIENAVDFWYSSNSQNVISVNSFKHQQYEFSLDVVEKTGSIIINKIDSDSNEYIGGATFTLNYYNDDKIQETVVLNVESGKLQVDNLKLGKYELIEVQSPKGYVKSEDVYTIELLDQNVVEISVFNAKQRNQETSVGVLPKAGFKNNFMCLFLLIFTLVLYRFFMLKRLLK